LSIKLIENQFKIVEIPHFNFEESKINSSISSILVADLIGN
jgi:hypothetical protein